MNYGRDLVVLISIIVGLTGESAISTGNWLFHGMGRRVVSQYFQRIWDHLKGH